MPSLIGNLRLSGGLTNDFFTRLRSEGRARRSRSQTTGQTSPVYGPTGMMGNVLYNSQNGSVPSSVYLGGASYGVGPGSTTGRINAVSPEQQLLDNGEITEDMFYREAGASPTSPTGGIEGGTAPIWEPRYFQGILYTDPVLYQIAVSQAQDAEYGRQRGLGETAFRTSRENLGYDYSNNLNALTGARDDSLQSQAGYFSAISPEAYQSQQDTYANKTRGEFDTARTDLDRQRSQGEAQLTGNENEFYRVLDENRQGLLDELGNVILDYSNNLGQSAAFQPGNIGEGLGNLTRGRLNPEDRTQRRASFKNLGLTDAQLAALEAYLYG